VKRGRFDGKNQLTARGELALVWKFDLDNISALTFQGRNVSSTNARHSGSRSST